MSTQGRTSDQLDQLPQIGVQTAPPTADDGTNQLHRWVRLVQHSTLWGNDAGQVRLDELAQGPTTPRIQTLEEIRAARTAAVAEEDAAEGAGGTSWWDDAVCMDVEAETVEEVFETAGLPAVEEPQVCELDESSGEFGESPLEDSGYTLEPERAEMPPIFTLPPLVTPPTTLSPVPPVLPAAGEGLLGRILGFGARWLGPVVVGMWPKPTAPPEMTDYPDFGPGSGTGPDGGLEPVGDELPKDDNKCEAWKVDHLGGDKVHNQCADSIPGNVASGGDWLVAAPVNGLKNFDAYTPADNTVWEVKTMGLGGYNPFVQRRELGKEALAAEEDNKVARECGYQYAWQVSDLAHYLAIEPMLAPLGIPVTFQPECLRKQGDMP